MIVPTPRGSTAPQAIQLEKVLLVEGETPKHFFEALAKHLGISPKVEVRSFGGIKQLGDFLALLSSLPSYREKVKSLGIIRDAENDYTTAHDAVFGALGQTKVDRGIVKVFILPDNRSPGMIETLMLQSIAEKPHYPCINGFLECARAQGVTFPADITLAKNQAQIHLATLNEVQMMPGFASYHKAWPLDHACFGALRDFLLAL